MKKIAIVGGGIAGLATAYFLQTCASNGPVDFQVIDGAPTFGGKIVSARVDGFVIEGGPDSFLTSKSIALELCRALGLGDQLIPTNYAARKTFVWSRGQLRPMPEGMALIVPTRVTPFITSSLLSWRGKLRMGLEVLIPPRRDDGDESLAHFVRRRLGAEALDKVAEPLIAGIYVADAEDLSLKSTFPRFRDMERQHGGLLRAMLKQRRRTSSGPAPTMFMTLRGGLQDLVDALLEHLRPDALFSNRRVLALERDAGAYTLNLSDGSQLRADAVVCATPAYVTADLVQAIDPALASALREIRYVSTATVSLGFKRAELAQPLDGFGFVVPRSEQRQILACTWSSTKFDYRAPVGYALLRAFVGGAHSEALVAQDDESLIQTACAELRAMMGITATPVFSKVYRWPKANPQYSVGHQARVSAIESLAAQHAGLYLAGSAYHGVGIPDCIQDGARVAQQILQTEPA